ncbi:MAG TPA: hypothetical protein VNA25_30860 [Phycisphaerae bacterium]|nr:hypothetical protein [Phycisphaerae bacterium]
MARGWNVAKADDLVEKVCKPLGIDPSLARRVVIDLKYDDPVIVYVELMGSVELLDVDWDAIFGDVKVVKLEPPA